MTRPTPETPWLTILLLTFIFSAQPAPADGSSTVERDQSIDGGVLVRYAVLLGTVDSDVSPPKNSHRTVDRLLDWDFQRDNDELMKLLGLRAIHTLQHSSVQFDRDKGEVGISTTAGDKKIDVEMSLQVFGPGASDPDSATVWSDDEEQPPYATLWFKVMSAGEVLSAPTVSSLLGKRAIVSTFAEDKSWIIFLVVEVHDSETLAAATLDEALADP